MLLRDVGDFTARSTPLPANRPPLRPARPTDADFLASGHGSARRAGLDTGSAVPLQGANAAFLAHQLVAETPSTGQRSLEHGMAAYATPVLPRIGYAGPLTPVDLRV